MVFVFYKLKLERKKLKYEVNQNQGPRHLLPPHLGGCGAYSFIPSWKCSFFMRIVCSTQP